MKDKLMVHITDKTSNTDLKIFEKDSGKSFTFCFTSDIYGVKTTRSITLDEETASLLFMGLNEIYEVTDKEVKKEKKEEKDDSAKILEDFFNKLNQYDKKFFK